MNKIFYQTFSFIFMLFAVGFASAGETDVAKSPLKWTVTVGDKNGFTIVDPAKPVYKLDPLGSYFSVQTDPIAIDEQLLNRGKIVSFKVKNSQLESCFAVLLEFKGADKKVIGKNVLYALSPKSRVVPGWKDIKVGIGKSGRVKIPKEAKEMFIRMAFSSLEGKGGSCEGKVDIENFSIGEAAKEEWPGSILITCGDISTRLENRSHWTLYRLDYKGKRLGVDNYGAHYGSVAFFKNIGFIGSGHCENGDSEKVISKELKINQKDVGIPKDSYKCDSMEFIKVSKLRSLKLDTDIKLSSNRLIETVTVNAEKPEKLKLIYHFMHPWVTSCSDYIAQTLDGKIIDEKFINDSKFRLSKPVKWSGVYNDKLKIGQITYISCMPEKEKFIVKYWDIQTRYRKHYLEIRRGLYEPGKSYRYQVVIEFFSAEPENWKATATAKANEIKSHCNETGFSSTD
jgi:hypothetical protein